MKLDNPNSNKEFERISKDARGEDEYGYRTVDGIEEIVHLPTGRSNMSYYQPQSVLNPVDCEHMFDETNKGEREYVCRKCQFGLTAHITQLIERGGTLLIKLQDGEYRVI